LIVASLKYKNIKSEKDIVEVNKIWDLKNF
jgi:hypothetical protein